MARAGDVHEPQTDLRLIHVPDFGHNPGALRMLAWAPAPASRGAALVVALHGCGQSAQAFVDDTGWLQLASRLGFALLAPEQTRSNNPGRCFNWYEPGDRARGVGEAASIVAMIDRTRALFGVDPARVFAVGLSAGGCMTLNLLAAYTEVFAAGAVIAAAPYGSASNLQQAMLAMMSAPIDDAPRLADQVRRAAPSATRWPRLSVWYGSSDPTVSAMNGPSVAAQWRTLLGLQPAPDRVERSGRLERQAWIGSGGEALVELNRIEGLGHGAPIATAGPDALGRRGPFVIDAGVSSTLRIARFFGLENGRGRQGPIRPAPAPPQGRLRSLLARLAARLR